MIVEKHALVSLAVFLTPTLRRPRTRRIYCSVMMTSNNMQQSVKIHLETVEMIRKGCLSISECAEHIIQLKYLELAL